MGKEIAFKFIQEIASIVKPKSARFLTKQAKDIELFGEKQVLREGVTDDMLLAFTPFRRLSKKPCSLSDPKYFIEQYEKNAKQLPCNWSELSEAQKVDLIVKERYEQLVANKIMNTIKNEPVEHSFALATNGEIVAHDVGNEIHADCINSQRLRDLVTKCRQKGLTEIEESQPHSSIHVHPQSSLLGLHEKVIEYMKSKNIKIPKFYAPFSPGDLRKYCSFGEIGYVIDSSGNKFKFTPFNLGKVDRDAGKNIDRLYNEYSERIINPLYEKVEILSKKTKGTDDICMAIVDLQTTMFNMQHRKKYLQSKEVTDYFGIFEELGNG